MSTVADILTRRGIDPGRRHGREHRTCCSVHGGTNDTAFSYTETLWHCHACGAGGDVVALVAALDGVDRQTAARSLRDRSGRRSVRERSEARRRARERDQADLRRHAAQTAWASTVQVRDCIEADVGLVEGVWRRDQAERFPMTRRALDMLGDLYMQRDLAEVELWSRWGACNRVT